MATEHGAVEPVRDEIVRQFARAALLAALIGAVAPVSIPIPFSPAPITLQVLFVFLAGLVLGPVWGTVSLTLYLAAGAVGIPVFAGFSAGPGVLFGRSGGYLWAYPVAAGLIGLLVHRGTDLRAPADVSLPVLVGALVAGTAVIYGMGSGYMAWLLDMTVVEALMVGAVPFVPVELLKLVAAIAIVKSGRLQPVGT
ncbi:biotin transport system substrate-specific component [Halobiforma haloterrestris]|uniref:Biotin transport system substrate-specific component n=1 Tax=Natronobacterium haloterrestre TaxID=148448 RepID=A0A1I1K745_NATHA|nr:biotin transporter BioY [Halobiforma haloterrestris]SFC56082.1 biotin transport system substrate-specific component [Halobiforma haloterrestris]